MAWADDVRFGGESPDAALMRRVKMHEFIAAGGIQVGVDPETKVMIYSAPVTPESHDICPWHGDPCAAWDEIKAGRGHGAHDGPTLRELRAMTDVERREASDSEMVEKIRSGARVSHADARSAIRQAREETLKAGLTGDMNPDRIELDGEEDQAARGHHE